MEHLQAAIELAHLGLCVFPLKARDKRAHERWKRFQTEHPTTSEIEKWWSGDGADRNIAVATGPVSGVIVIDVDGDIGAESLAKLTRVHGGLPTTWRSSTGRGEHIWFRAPTSVTLGNTAGRIGPGIDTRGAGGYVVAPPSIHPSGSLYDWQTDSHPAFVQLAELPQWLFDILAPAPVLAPEPEPEPLPPDPDRVKAHLKYCRTALDNQRDELAALASEYLR